MPNDDLSRLLEKHSTLELLDRNIKEASQFFATVDRDHKVKTTVGFTATCAVSQLSRLPTPDIKRRRTSPLQEFDPAEINAAMKVAADTSRSRALAKQQLGAAVWGLINNTLLAKSIAQEFEGQGVPEKQGLVYAQNVAKVLFQKIDEYIQGYAGASSDELQAVGILDAVRMVDPSLVESAPRTQDRAKSPRRSRTGTILLAVTATLAGLYIITNFAWISGTAVPLFRSMVLGQEWGSEEEKSFFRAIGAGDIATVRHYLHTGTSANNTSLFGMPPLYFAQTQNQPEVMKLLIQSGANLDLKFGPSERTALHDAALGGRLECMRVLLEAGADPNVRNKFGRTPLNLASNAPPPLKPPQNLFDVVQLLMTFGGM